MRDPFEDLINCKDSDILPVIGDFSIIPHKFIRESITHDFKFFNSCDLWYLLDLPKFIDKAIILNIKKHCHPKHTNESFIGNLYALRYIYKYGWTEFVFKLQNQIIYY